jgi:hypothetical protein
MSSHRRVFSGARRLLAVIAVAIAIAGCGSQAGLAIPAGGPLVTVTTHGGECATAPCDQTIYLEQDGRVHVAAKPPNDLGTVPAAQMAAITEAISATDLAKLRAPAFTGQCPTVVDGQELIFEFATAGGTQRISSCQVAIDWGSPLFVAIGAALGQWVPLPTT